MVMELDAAQVLQKLPERPAEGHKGTFGHVFVIAGSRGYTGAAKLAAEGAGRSGAGLVTLGIAFPLANVIAAGLLETMSLRLPSTEQETIAFEALEAALQFANRVQSAVLGPGLSSNSDTVQFVLDFLPGCPVPLVLDADGLNALSEQPALAAEAVHGLIMTPHPGEMARLTGLSTEEIQGNREAVAAQYAQEWNSVVVLKGHPTIVAAPGGPIAVNSTGNHGLAKGGTGDILAGLLGGLLAQGMTPFDAACTGVYLHGLAGDLAQARYTSRGMLAGDVLQCLPEAWKALEEDRPQRAGFLA